MRRLRWQQAATAAAVAGAIAGVSSSFDEGWGTIPRVLGCPRIHIVNIQCSARWAFAACCHMLRVA